MINLYLYRKYQIEEGSVGELHTDEIKYCVTLEDLPRAYFDKVPGKTRIPQGRYPIRLRQVLSGLTKRYRQRYTWFTWHLEICDVPFFENVYLHIGNKPEDTDGCVLVGERVLSNRAFITNSTDTYRELYEVLRKALENGEEVWIDIFDED